MRKSAKVMSAGAWHGRRLLVTTVSLLVASVGLASEVKIIQQQGQETFLEGTLEGISIDPTGTLRLADRATRIAAVDDPYVFSASVHPEGWVLGTGNNGRVLLLDRSGAVRELFETEEPEVFAVWVDDDGTVFAGSSPEGKVYRLAAGASESTVLFDPEQTYIWALARDQAGRLLVATGTEGKLFAIDEEGVGELLYDSEDVHLRSLLPLAAGGVLVGTAGEGLVLEVDASGNARTLYDATGPEVVAFAQAADGTRYAAALASEASFVDLSRATRSGSSEQQGQGEDKSGDENGNGNGSTVSGGQSSSVTVQEGSVTLGSRPAGFSGARAEVLRLDPVGAVEKLWSFDGETVYSMLWHRDRLWVATGLGGKIYSWQGRQMVLEKDVDEQQIVALLGDDPGPAFVTTNVGALYRMESGTERQGSYTSGVLDASQVSRFGTLHWRGDTPPETRVEWQTRSGMSASPDDTWSPWSPPVSGNELSLSDMSRGRYLQWRALLTAANGATPSIQEVELSYLQLNQRPTIAEVEVLAPGQVLVPANFNPSNQVYEPPSPNRDGIFTALDATRGGSDSSRSKQLWKQGHRSLQWSAEDPNEDELRYALYFRRDSAPSSDEPWLRVAERLEETYYSFDSTVLPDGLYRFRLVASDEPSNVAGEALEAEYVTAPVTVDHSAPQVVSSVRSGPRVTVVVSDTLSPLRGAEVSIDATEWRPAAAQDGLLDGREERLEIEVGEGARLLLLRLTDAAYNVVTHDLSGTLDGSR